MRNRDTFGIIMYQNTKTGEYRLRLGADVDYDKIKVMSKEHPDFVISHYESDLPDHVVCGAQGIGMNPGSPCVQALAKLAASEETREDLERYMTELFFIGLGWQKELTEKQAHQPA